MDSESVGRVGPGLGVSNEFPDGDVMLLVCKPHVEPGGELDSQLRPQEPTCHPPGRVEC